MTAHKLSLQENDHIEKTALGEGLLLEPIGNVPPAEAEMTYYAELETRAVAA